MNNKTSKLIKISLLSAIALILMYFDFPVIPIFPWLKIDLSDVPALLGAFGFGPIVGILIELIKNFKEYLNYEENNWYFRKYDEKWCI